MCLNFYSFGLSVFVVAAGLQPVDLRAATPASFLTAGEQAKRIAFATDGSLNRYPGLEYEKLVHSQLDDAGYRVRQTKSPNNMGVDRIATRNGEVKFIQAKALRSARLGAVGGLLDALEFYGGAPETRIPYLRDGQRRFVVSVPNDKYSALTRNGLIGRDGVPLEQLIKSTESASSANASKRGPKAVRYRAVASYKQEILTKVRFEPGPVAYDEIPVPKSNRKLLTKGTKGEVFGGKPAPAGHQTTGKWLGRAGIVALIATEGYVIQGFATGRLSEREFVTAQSAIVGGGLGGWGGATGGAALGALGGPFAPVTVPAGAIVGGLAGGFGGAKLGEMAASGFYGRLDEKQKRQIEAFVYQHYGVIP